jgi:uncharacterized protein YjbI with pentapeptide repeats
MFCLHRAVFFALLLLSLHINLVHAGKQSPSAEVEGNIAVLLETRNCPQCDLSGTNLSRFDLSNTNLEGVNLSRSKLTLTNLSDANLQNADLREANFSGADLANTDMRGADLTGAIFVGAYMVGALLDGEMINTKPYAGDAISDVEEVIYVEDTAKSKVPQETEDMNIGRRRDFEETPPLVPINISEKATDQKPEPDGSVEIDIVSIEETSDEILPRQSAVAPDSKDAPEMSVVHIQEEMNSSEDIPVIVDTKKELVSQTANDEIVEKVEEKRKIVVEDEPPVESVETENTVETIKTVETVTIENAKEEDIIEEESTQAITLVKEDNIDPGESKESKGIVDSVLNIFSSPEASTEVLKNGSILLDSNRCYGCGLQGINLSGENLEGADLEGADLSNAILKEVDLEGANLKGANLSGADLSGADLSEADLYKADLSGANLTGANLEEALLDDVILTGVIGYTSPGLLFINTK